MVEPHRYATMSGARRSITIALTCAVGLAVSTWLGVGYSARQGDHAGLFLVPVADTLTTPAGFRRPRRTVVVVFDGLGYVDAAAMGSFARLASVGRCLRTDVGEPSISRPVYAVLSTGLEQDRTGVRGNDDPSPIAAESVWEIARDAGLTVSAVSEMPWWRELFPRGFDEYVTPPRETNFFDELPASDVVLVHPLYVDETAHENGAVCRAYDECVSRADRELGGLLDSLDLAEDLVVVTADHGHSLAGGHGGPQDTVVHTMTCYAGVGVRHDGGEGVLRATSIGPSLALLLGLHFPSTMRAGDDDLDALATIADPDAFPAGYLDERWRTIERFRHENEAELRAWLPSSEGSWRTFRAHHRALQLLRALPFAVLVLLVLVLRARVRTETDAPTDPRRGGLFGVTFVLLFFLGLYALQIVLRGSFDLSSVSVGPEFIQFTLAMSFGWSLVSIGGHLRLRRDLEALLLDWGVLSLVGTLLGLAHPAALGFQLGYPAPASDVYFFPYFAALALGVVHTTGVLLCGISLARWTRRTARTPA